MSLKASMSALISPLVKGDKQNPHSSKSITATNDKEKVSETMRGLKSKKTENITRPMRFCLHFHCFDGSSGSY